MKFLIIFFTIISFLLPSKKILGQTSIPDSVNKSITGLKEGYWMNYYNADILICFLKGFASTWNKNYISENINFCKRCIERGGKIDSTTYYCIKSEGSFSKNLKQGLWIFYECDSLFEDFTYYKKTIKNGMKIFQVIFFNDSINGLVTTYYPDEKIKSEIEFKNNSPLGSIKCYFNNGKLKISGTIKENNKFFSADEYSVNGYKLQTRYFLLEDILKEWTKLNEIEQLITTH